METHDVNFKSSHHVNLYNYKLFTYQKLKLLLTTIYTTFTALIRMNMVVSGKLREFIIVK